MRPGSLPMKTDAPGCPLTGSMGVMLLARAPPVPGTVT